MSTIIKYLYICSWDVKHSIKNIVNGTVITMNDDRDIIDLVESSLCEGVNV